MKKLVFMALLALTACGSTVVVEQPPPCHTCGEEADKRDGTINLCEDSLVKYGALYACVCDPVHLAPFPCQEWCSGGEASYECVAGFFENECFNAYQVCQTDK